MKGVRSRTCNDGDLPTRSTPELGRKGGCLDAKLLHGIHGHEAVRPARSAERGERPSTGLHQRKVASNAEIGADPIHGEIICVGALAIHAELSLIVESCGRYHHARSE